MGRIYSNMRPIEAIHAGRTLPDRYYDRNPRGIQHHRHHRHPRPPPRLQDTARCSPWKPHRASDTRPVRIPPASEALTSSSFPSSRQCHSPAPATARRARIRHPEKGPSRTHQHDGRQSTRVSTRAILAPRPPSPRYATLISPLLASMVSPTDNLMSPVTAKLTSAKQRHFMKYAISPSLGPWIDHPADLSLPLPLPLPLPALLSAPTEESPRPSSPA